MKKELAVHFLTTIVLFLLLSLFRHYFAISFWPLWVGGIIGTILPDVDHVIYVYYLRPYEVTSQRVMYEANKGNLMQVWDLLSATRAERRNLILHSVIFQVLFLVLGFFVITSTSSLLGRGLVLAFLMHLFVDEIIDLRTNGSLMNWLKNIPFEIDKMQIYIYLIFNFAAILIFGFLM